MQGDLLLGGAQLVELAEEVAHRPRHLRAAQRACEIRGDVGRYREIEWRYRGDMAEARGSVYRAVVPCGGSA